MMINCFLLLSTILTVAGILMAAALPKLIHSVLCLIVSFVGIAFIYLTLNAQFVGFAQILVYVGAVAILLIFAILMTDRNTLEESDTCWRTHNMWGGIIGGGAFVILGTLVSHSKFLKEVQPLESADTSVKAIGEVLMNQHIASLEMLALALTVSVIGGVVLIINEKEWNQR